MFYVLLAFAGISSYVAFMSRNILLRLGASIFWLALWNYIANNYPSESWTVFATLGCWAMAIAVPLSLFEKLIDYKRTPNKGGTLYDKPEASRLEAAEGEAPSGTLNRAFNRFVGNENPPKARRSGETPEEYRARVHHALRGRKRR